MPTYSNNSYAVKNVSTSGSVAISSIASGTVAVSSLILVYQATVPVGGSLEAIQGNRVVLKTSDSLTVVSGTATSCDAFISALTAT